MINKQCVFVLVLICMASIVYYTAMIMYFLSAFPEHHNYNTTKYEYYKEFQEADNVNLSVFAKYEYSTFCQSLTYSGGMIYQDENA